MEDDIHKLLEMGIFFMKYGRMCCTTIPPKETTWPIVYVYHMQNDKYILLEMYSQYQFTRQIEGGKMSCESIEYPNKKIIQRAKISSEKSISVTYSNHGHSM